MKHMANILSISRIILLPALYFTFHHVLLFSIVYLLCGLSDALDGYIARRTNTQSELGARLDSLADLLFFAVITVSIILLAGSEIRSLLPWAVITTLIRGANLVIAACKYHSFAMLHTWGNKLAGGLLFLTPPLYLIFAEAAVLWPVCIAAVVSAAEETIIHLASPQLDLNRRSIFRV